MEYRLVRKEQVTSTNSYLAELVKEEGALEDIVIISDYQIDGRGQGSNVWMSNRGESILMSWLIQPELLSASDQFLVSKAVSLALCDHLNTHIGNVCIKWPNDILAGDRKIAGILIEHSIIQNRIAHSIIGIGLNVNQEGFPDYPTKPTSMCLEAGRQFDIEKQMRKLIKALYIRYTQLQKGNIESLNQAYLEHLFRYRQRSLFESAGKQIEGVIVGVNEYGQLMVEIKGQIKSFNMKEIHLIIQ